MEEVLSHASQSLYNNYATRNTGSACQNSSCLVGKSIIAHRQLRSKYTKEEAEENSFEVKRLLVDLTIIMDVIARKGPVLRRTGGKPPPHLVPLYKRML